MASTNKSTVLGLSLWTGTDKPRRADFVADNTALETLVGGHMNNADLHLDAARKARIDAPFEVKTVTGTGAESRSVIFSFSPTAAIAFAVGKGAAEYNGTYTKRYVGFAAGGQNSAGVSVSSVQVRLYQTQTTPAAGGAMNALNESGVTYAVMAFR